MPEGSRLSAQSQYSGGRRDVYEILARCDLFVADVFHLDDDPLAVSGSGIRLPAQD